MSGFPRSGSTLLTVLLNQHPKIYASHQSGMANILSSLENSFNQSEQYLSGNAIHRYYQVLNKIPNIFYEDIEKEIIIDKFRGWGDESLTKYMKIINQDYKIIFVKRPILEILSSIIKLNRKNIDNKFVLEFLEKNNYPDISFYNEIEYSEYFINNFMKSFIEVFETLNKKENLTNVFFVSYKDIVFNTQETMSKIYNFLDIENYDNNLLDIVDKEPQDDTYFGVDLHSIKNTIQNSKSVPEEILDESILLKYKDLLI